MNTPLAIAFIALLFSGCAAQVQQNRVCKAKIKQTKALLSELVPQDTIDGRVCMLRPMEDELLQVARENVGCIHDRNIQDFLHNFDGYVYQSASPDNGTEHYQIAIWQCYADSVRHGFIVLTFSTDTLGVITRVKYIPIGDGRVKIIRKQSPHHNLLNKKN
jgi:hypothetical protein